LTARLFAIAPGWAGIFWRALVLISCYFFLSDPLQHSLQFPRSILAILGLVGFLPALALMTLDIEVAQARPLAYFQLLPQKVRPAHLVHWPMRFLGVVGAILFTTFGHLPPLAMLIVAACAWWGISVGHWLAGRGGWNRTLVLLLVSAQALLVGIIASGSLPAAAIVAVITALVGLFVSRRTSLGRLLAPPGAPLRGNRSAKGGIYRDRDVSLDRGHRRRSSSYRLFTLAALAPGFLRWGWTVVVISAGITAGLSLLDLGAFAWMQWIVVAMMASGGLTRTTDAIKTDFLVTRPLTARRRFAATVLPWIALVLIAPVAQALLVRISVATRSSYTVDASTHRIFRILGVSAQSFVHSGRLSSVAVTNDLLWLLYRNALRMSLLGLAILFVFPLHSIPRLRETRLRFVIWGLAVAIVATVLPYYTVFFGLRRGSLPPLWLAALLASVSGAMFFRQVFFRTR
jgi:hypothetical protein